MNTLMRNMVLMCFSVFVLNTAILAHADVGYFADNLQKIKEYIASDTLHYYIKDYQGNVRSVVRQDGAVVESDEYYPYGGLFSATASAQPYKYSSKELDRMHGLDLYDSEARWYDSLLGRTTTMDPLAEKYYSLSPYLWCAGNPVKFVDPSGCIIEIDPSITEEEKRFLEDNLDILKGSEVFYTFFSELKKNANFVVIVTFGETEKVKKSSVDEESVYGQYDPNNSTITFKKDIWVPGVTIVEEFYHAYQDMISKQNNNGEVWNREFEAKTIATICAYESVISMPSYNMDDFGYFDNLYQNCHDYLKNIARLKSYYLKKGKEFSNFWKNKNQKGYSEPVNAFPSTLSNILNKCKK